MKIKKELINSLGKKKYFSLNYDTEQELINAIQVIIKEFPSEQMYALIHKKDEFTLKLFDASRTIELENNFLLECNKDSFFENVTLENIVRIRDLTIYAVDKITTNDSKEIKKILYNSLVEINFGNYLEVCQFGLVMKDKSSLVSGIIKKLNLN